VTEREWLDSDDPQVMLHVLQGNATSRKLRLFACACVRRIWPLVPQDSREIVQVSVDYADSRATSRDLGHHRKAARIPVLHPSKFMTLSLAPLLRPDFGCPDACELAESVARFVGWECCGGRPVQYVMHPEIVQAENKAQAIILRDICGNPFRQASVDPTWQTPELASLGQAIYMDQAFDRLPVLADALEEAGCVNAELLEHFRAPGEHVRGCWAVDLLLGKA
jgi:hypothetical protein